MNAVRRFSCTDAPLQIHGLFAGSLPDHFFRLPPALDSVLPEPLVDRARHPAGGRIRFRTDAPEITVRMALDTLTVDWAIAMCGSAAMVAAVGMGKSLRYAGLVCPKQYDEMTPSLTLRKEPKMEDVTLFLPRNERLHAVTIEVPDGARVEAPTPYAVPEPIVFYGSSITEGGCASRVTNAYPALLSKWLNADTLNLGFSGAAKGELPLAEYIAGLKMSAFVYDYDHNAPTPGDLAATHGPFFRKIRQRQPGLPILILSRPDFDSNPADSAARRDIVRRTAENAAAAGDAHTFFVDGQTFFGPADRADCTVDQCHPNDLGFYRMAEAIYPILKKAL